MRQFLRLLPLTNPPFDFNDSISMISLRFFVTKELRLLAYH